MVGSTYLNFTNYRNLPKKEDHTKTQLLVALRLLTNRTLTFKRNCIFILLIHDWVDSSSSLKLLPYVWWAQFSKNVLYICFVELRQGTIHYLCRWGGLARIKGGGSRQFENSPRGGVMRKLAYKREGCLILQFCFISKKCVHCCRQY